ncbi:MAG TPA: succinylglutamate desuccinylase/aspartoacylase family protein, partial [Cyclobacteriaceae bacterium]|nr:succinylglutamate desuccinylase/aspartoacylase family protein [Cyclobacteriaceae bacterium]
ASAALGFPYVVGSVSDNGSIGAAAVAGTPGFLAELGQCGRWSPDEVKTYCDATLNVLRHLGVLRGKPIVSDDVAFLSKMQVSFAGKDGCWYPSIKLQDVVSKGDKLGEIRDFFGNVLEEYFAESGGVVLYLVTSLAIVSGDPLAAVGVE